jgi:phage virion morphogenesis protein
MQVTVQSNGSQVAVRLDGLAAGLKDVNPLLKTIAAGQLVSIRRTFDEEGSPAGSWTPLAESTKKKKGYTAGHKLLILRGRLLNSINAVIEGNTVIIGTGIVYAAVHQYGSRDRGAAIGPQARIEGYDVQVKAYDRLGVRGKKRIAITNALGRLQMVTRDVPGPLGKFGVKAHGRFQNIPARPYLVFRPEDPARIEAEVRAFVAGRAKESGLL